MAVVLTLLTASTAGFAMSQVGPRWRAALIALCVVLLMVPLTALWLTRFLIFKDLGLLNSHAALLAPALMGSSPLFVLLFYWTFSRVPPDLFDSARLDGAGPFAAWRLVGLPLARPTIAAVAALTFLQYWGDFINPLLYLRSQSLYTLPVGLQQLQQLDRTDWPLLMAGAIVLTVPSLLAFLVVQRHFLQEDRLAGLAGP
jgi:multiple sugar transport system permease protein